MKFYSTNGNSGPVSFKDALLLGQAPDKGLYMPDSIPQISPGAIAAMKNMPYHSIASTVMHTFLKNEIDEGGLQRLAKEAYNLEVPIEQVAGKTYVMRLDQGPTASFKDFAARMMSRLMQYYLERGNRKLVILTATSGDTGSAVANAFYGLDNVEIVVLFPCNEVSDRQRRQMTTLGGNVTAIAVEGKFDECQAMAKQAFSDAGLRQLNLSSANSINIGRLLPQTVYYFYAYSRLSKAEEVVFSVPSGNFGNLVAALIAKRMGLPVHMLVAAVNENDEFPRFLETGTYEPIRPSKACISSAMNVGHPSNLARLVDMYGGQMDEQGQMKRMPDLGLMRREIYSPSISDAETRKTMKNAYNRYKLVLEPHGAVAWAGMERFLSLNESPMVSVALETAHPAKFPEEITNTLGFEPKLPRTMEGLDDKTEEFEILPADYKRFKTFLISKFDSRNKSMNALELPAPIDKLP